MNNNYNNKGIYAIDKVKKMLDCHANETFARNDARVRTNNYSPLQTQTTISGNQENHFDQRFRQNISFAIISKIFIILYNS